MTLKQYIEKYKLTQTQAASKFAASNASISQWLSGGRVPSYAMKMLIQAKTKGAVSLDSWE